MDVKSVYADANGTLSVWPEPAASGRPPSLALAAAYLTLSSVAIASNAMVLTGVATADRLRTPYAVLASALCVQCALDAAAGHYAATRELMQAGDGSGGGAGLACRGVATVTAALSAVQLVTFAALAALDAFVQPDYALPPPAAAALWAAPSVYTYVILTPTLLLPTRYFPSRGRCGFIANTNGWFYPFLLIVFSFMIPWSISFYLVFVSRPSTAPKPAVNDNSLSPAHARNRPNLVPSKLILASYTTLVTPGFISSCVYLFAENPGYGPWAGNEVAEHALDGYLSRMPVVFDVCVPLILIYHHKAFRKKCRQLYLHGFSNSVSDDSQTSARRPRRPKDECLGDDAPVLFLERSGAISVRIPSEDGFAIRECDLYQDDGARLNGKKAVRFSEKVHRVSDENGVRSAQHRDENQETSL